MYVVRITPAGGEPDFKAYERLEDARSRFDAAWAVDFGDLDAAVLFHVPGETDVRRAVSAVKEGRAQIVDRDHWKQLQESASRAVAEMIAKGKATDA